MRARAAVPPGTTRGHAASCSVLPVVAIVAAIIAAVVPIPRGWVEGVYARDVYPALQPRLTALSNLVPWAVTDLLTACLAVWVVWRVVREVRRGMGRGWPGAAVRAVLALFAVAAAFYLWFLLAWGLQYRRAPLADRLDFSSARITPDAARSMAERAVSELNALHDTAHRAGWPSWGALPDRLSGPAEQAWVALGVRHRVRTGRPKRSLAGRYLQWAGVSGFTSPFVLEVVPDWDLPAFVRPDVLAHEWAHLAGFADESEAGFAGWLTGLHGPVWARYSAWLAITPRLVAAVPEPGRAKLLARVNQGPRDDWRELARYHQRSNPLVRKVSWRAYDRFLKANRVDAGLASYDRVTRLVLGTRFREGWQPIARR